MLQDETQPQNTEPQTPPEPPKPEPPTETSDGSETAEAIASAEISDTEPKTTENIETEDTSPESTETPPSKEIDAPEASGAVLEPSEPIPQTPQSTPSPQTTPPQPQITPNQYSQNSDTTGQAYKTPPNFIKKLLIKARAKIQQRKQQKLDKIIQLLSEKGKIANKDVQKLLRVSDTSATRYLDILEKQSKIKQVGKTGKAVFYQKI